MHAVREVLDELLTLDLSRRSARQRQIDERAVRIVRESAGLLQAVRATANWPRGAGQAAPRPGRPWRILVGGIGGTENRAHNYALISMGFAAAGFIGPTSAGFAIDHFGRVMLAVRGGLTRSRQRNK